RTRGVEPEIPRETQVSQCIPTTGTALRRGVAGIDREKPAHCGVIPENRRSIDVVACDFRLCSQDRLGRVESPRCVAAFERHACCLDEGRYGIIDSAHLV